MLENAGLLFAHFYIFPTFPFPFPFLFARTLTYMFLSLWTVAYTALEFRLLPESESEPRQPTPRPFSALGCFSVVFRLFFGGGGGSDP